MNASRPMRGLISAPVALLLAAWAVVAACGGESNPPDPRVEADRRLEAGLLELTWRTVDEAQAQFAKAHRLRSSAPETLACLVVALVLRGEREEARGLLDGNASMERKHSQLGRLRALLADEDRSEREEIPEPSTALDHFVAGMAALAEGKPAAFVRAMNHFDAAGRLSKEAKSPRLLYLVAKATAALLGGKRVTAWRVMEAVADRWDHAATAWMLKGQVHHRFNRRQADARFEKALEIDPDLLLPRYRVGFVKSRLGDLDGAIAAYEAVACRRPRQATWPLQVGTLRQKQGRVDEAIAAYRTTLELEPRQVEARQRLVWLLFQRADIDGMVEQCEEALERNPILPRFHLYLGLAAGRKGDLDEALEHYTESERLSPSWVQAHNNLGTIWFLKGEWRRARGCFRRANPNHVQAKQNLEACENAIRLEPGLEACVAGTKEPETAKDAACVAEMAYITERYAAATRLFRDAFSRDPALRKDPSRRYRRIAIWAAIRAANGEGRDAATLNEAERVRHRRQAMAWFESDLEEKKKHAEEGKLEKRYFARDLQFWRHHPAYAPLRDESELKKLSADEQEACRAIWKRVDALVELMKAKHGF